MQNNMLGNDENNLSSLDNPKQDNSISPPNHDPIDINILLDVFKRRKGIIFIVIFATVLIGVAYILLQRPIYESTAEIAVVANASNTAPPYGELNLIDDFQVLTRSKSIETQKVIISNEIFQSKAYDALPADVKKKGFNTNEMPKWAVQIDNIADILKVTVRSYNPQSSARLANDIANSYLFQDLDRKQKLANKVISYSLKQLEILQKELNNANADLSSYKRKSGIALPEIEIPSVAQHLSILQIERSDAITALSAKNSQINALKELLAENKSSHKSINNDELLNEYTKAYALRAAFKAKLAAIDDNINSIKRKSQDLPEKEKNLIEKQQKVDTLQRTYDMLSERYYSLLSLKNSMLPNGELIYEAIAPNKPAHPHKVKILAFSMFLGILISIIITFAYEHLDKNK